MPLYFSDMKTNKGFTARLKAYMAQPEDQRDITEGAALLLRLGGNRFFHAAVTRSPGRYAKKLFYELDKHLRFRLAEETGTAVAALEKRVEAEVTPAVSRPAAQHKGKRPDHDSLPDDIKALYVDNANILHEMRDLHAKLRLKSADTYRPCDRFDDLTALLSLHDRYVANWEAYDHAAPLSAAGATSAPTAAEEPTANDATEKAPAGKPKPKRKTRTRDSAK